MNRHIEELGFHETNYTYIPNGVVIDESQNQPAPTEMVEKINELKEKDKFVLMYLGGFSKANALEDLIASACDMEDNIHIVMVGDGPLKQEYMNKIKELKLENISIMPSVLKTQVNKTLALADALYIGAKRIKLYKYGVGMNKIFDYMLSKRPIINGVEASNDPISDAACGITIKPENPQAIASAAKQLSETTKQELNEMGLNGYNYVLQNHNYEKLAKRFAIVLH